MQENGRQQRLQKIYEFLIISALSVLIVYGTVCGMGTLTSGVHMVDDHEFLEWQYNMQYQGRSVYSLIREWVPRDFWWRYEPAYYTARILSVGLFGTDLVKFSVLKAAEIVLAFIFLYYSGRMMEAKRVYSFLFALISLVGYQSAVWWKLGPQEAQCTMLFSMGFFCMLKWMREEKKGWGIASILLFFLMSNYKESFILLIPFIVCFVLYDTVQHRMDSGRKYTPVEFIRELLKQMKGRYWYAVIMSLIFVVLVGIIVFYVGVNDYAAVGLNPDVTIRQYMEAFWQSMDNDLKWYKRFGILFLAVLLTYWDELKKLWKEILLTAVFLIPQFIIFAQSGLQERYLLPSTMGYAFFFVVVISKWKPLQGKRRLVYIAGIILLLAANGRAMLIEADYFRFRGESVTGMLEKVEELADEDTKVLACFRPTEEANLTMYYWMLLHGFDGVYYWTEDDLTINRVRDRNMSYDDPGVYEKQNFEEMDIVVMYNQQDRHFCFYPSLDLSDFTKIECGTITIWVRKA